MNTKFNQLWFGAVKLAMFCSCLSSLFSPQCLAFGPPPVITVQPLDQAVPKGSTVTLTVEATSSTTLSYQWNNKVLLLNTPILGATNNTLTLNNASLVNSALYNVSVINGGGTASSRDAQVAVTNNTPVANNDAFTTPQNIPITNGTVSHLTSPITLPASLLAPEPRLATTAATISKPTSILDNDTDANGDTLLAVLVTSVAHGVLNLYSDGTFDYTPATDYVGNDSFTYKAFDSVAYSTIATVNITVTALMNSTLPPTATALDASDVTTASATLNAAINPQGHTPIHQCQL